MEKPKYKNYRVCYENGNAKTGKEIYELHKYCACSDCRYRQDSKRTPVNAITITTMDISKVDEIAEFLKNWSCEDGTKQLDTIYSRR
jgi:hypothetical protein